MRIVVCASGARLLMDYLEGVLPPALGADLEGHLAGCPRCTAFVQSYRETPGIFRRATAAAPPRGLARALIEDVLRRGARRPAEPPARARRTPRSKGGRRPR